MYTRIPPPEFYIDDYTLNEYELRQLMVDIAKGLHQGNLSVVDITGNEAIIDENGRLSGPLYGLDLNDKLAIELFIVNQREG